MKKHLIGLFLALCMLLPLTGSAAAAPVLPDFGAFADGLLAHDATEEYDWSTMVTYKGKKDVINKIVEDYISTLTSDYDFHQTVTFPVDLDSRQKIIHAFEYQKSGLGGSFNIYNTAQGWRVSYTHLVLNLVLYDSGTSYLYIYYRPEFNYTDRGDRFQGTIYTAAPKATATPKPTAASRSCSTCGGDGKCDKCGGDMWYWGYEWVYVNGSPVSQRVNKMCNATYCTGGKCSKCGGDGRIN